VTYEESDHHAAGARTRHKRQYPRPDEVREAESWDSW
jgi:hypothetical protein